MMSFYALWNIRAIRKQFNQRQHFHEFKKLIEEMQFNISDIKDLRLAKEQKVWLEAAAKWIPIVKQGSDIFDGAVCISFKSLHHKLSSIRSENSSTCAEMERIYLDVVQLSTEFSTIRF
jgi:hypothetical protein